MTDRMFDIVMFSDFLNRQGIPCVAKINGDHCNTITITDSMSGVRYYISHSDGVPLRAEKMLTIPKHTHTRVRSSSNVGF